MCMERLFFSSCFDPAGPPSLLISFRLLILGSTGEGQTHPGGLKSVHAVVAKASSAHPQVHTSKYFIVFSSWGDVHVHDGDRPS